MSLYFSEKKVQVPLLVLRQPVILGIVPRFCSVYSPGAFEESPETAQERAARAREREDRQRRIETAQAAERARKRGTARARPGPGVPHGRRTRLPRGMRLVLPCSWRGARSGLDSAWLARVNESVLLHRPPSKLLDLPGRERAGFRGAWKPERAAKPSTAERYWALTFANVGS